MSARRVALGLSILLACARVTARAQDDPAIQTAVRLAGEGRGDEARRMVNAELAKARVGEPAWVEALYWRARIAATGDSAERDLRRVAIEYPTSRWADDALLQLAQIATAAGNPVSAFALAQRLRSDYPDSDLRPRAALWAGRAAFDLGDARSACALLDSARAGGAADVEFTNQVDFYRSRCTALPATPARGVTPQEPASGAPPRTDTAHARPLRRRPSDLPRRRPPRAHDAIRRRARRVGHPGGRRADPGRGGTGFCRTLRGAGLTARVLIGADHLRRIRRGLLRHRAARPRAPWPRCAASPGAAPSWCASRDPPRHRPRHAAHAAVPRPQGAAPRRHPPVPDGRLLRDVRGGRRGRLARARAYPHQPQQRRRGRGPPRRRAGEGGGDLHPAPGREGLPGRDRRAGRGPEAGQGPRAPGGDRGDHAPAR